MKSVYTVIITVFLAINLYAGGGKKIIFVKGYTEEGRPADIELKLEVAYGDWGTVNNVIIMGYRNSKSWSGTYASCGPSDCQVSRVVAKYSTNKTTGYAAPIRGTMVFFKVN